jgi:hypothetical protein
MPSSMNSQATPPPTRIHVFYDNSNIYGGALTVRTLNEPSSHWAAFRIYYRNMFHLIEGSRIVDDSILAGSVPPACDGLWEYARSHGYSTDLLKRVEKDDGRIGEQGVDELLHLKIANCLLDNEPQNRALVVATGDGKQSEFGTGFRTQIERALKRGWKVEVWSWDKTLNSCYGVLMGKFPGLEVKSLDAYYYSVTFLKGGMYYDWKNGVQIPHPVQERVVSPLP